ncbi:MAG: hypothetical protein BWY66_00447 [bacterium ADurb.Bin374]|nr:MAG: hypothetical protein BWY66_00447 [bacterium ADurb.Bin374]
MSFRNNSNTRGIALFCALVMAAIISSAVYSQPAPTIANDAQVMQIASMTASDTPSFVYPPSSTGILPDIGQRQQLRVFVVHSLMHLHQAYGYISWSMSASRRNLTENLHHVHLKQVASYADQILALAHVVQRWDGASPAWTKVMTRLGEMKKAFELLQKAQGQGSGTAPDPSAEEAGKLFEQVGKDLPELFTSALATPSVQP